MFKKTMVATGVALAVAALPVVAEEDEGPFGDFEVSGELKNESAIFTKDGTTIGAPSAHDSGDLMKSETSLRLFINGPVGENAELHAELRPVYDTEAIDGYKGHENYSQQDFLRELYIDTTAGEEDEVSLRIGKQQVVWGTADGMKLLDIINPTDYREMAQNSMDESRIPVWMINAETDLEDGSNLQVVISQPKENLFAGLDRNIDTAQRQNNIQTGADLTAGGHDQGQPFVMKGPDTITGPTNGFLNIVPDLGSIAAGFGGQFTNAGLQGSTAMTVAMFNTMTNDQLNDQTWPEEASSIVGGIGANYDGAQIMGGFTGNYNTNLSAATSASNWGDVKDSAFEYMGNATFSTFDAFWNAKSEYQYDMPENSDVDLGIRVKRSLDNGLNYSLNYSYNYDKNPIINLSWRGANGELLYTRKANNTFYEGTPNEYTTTSLSLNTKEDGSGDAYGGVAVTGADGMMGCLTPKTYYAGTANEYTCTQAQMGDNDWSKSPTLRFEQSVKRAHNFGSALDYALDTEALGAVVLRGEFLYQKDVYQPVIDLDDLGIGDLVSALQMEKADRFKYVLGADITVLTNMMISAQFIQDRNLDHADSGNRFTTDYATMHLTNGFNKAEENKEFYSLFFSKPFGGEQQHRWNNILMLEENGGKWNRFDVEYSFNDELIGTFEYDKYWGDENTQFGQLEASSNLQLGLKYIF